MKAGIKTTEFWSTLIGLVVSLLVTVGVVEAVDAEALVGALVTVATSVLAIVVNARLVIEYVKGRVELKKEEKSKSGDESKDPRSLSL